jgi:hypothetical protein
VGEGRKKRHIYLFRSGDEMGLRGRHAVPLANREQYPHELVITDAALRVYRRMRRLELRCECPDDGDLETMCAACTEWWELQRQLARSLNLFEGMVVYEDPAWQSYRPFQCAIDRFHLLERAAKRTKEPRFRYKWEK